MIARLANLSFMEKALGALAAVLVSFLVVDNLVARAWVRRLQDLDRTISLERKDLIYKRDALARRWAERPTAAPVRPRQPARQRWQAAR